MHYEFTDEERRQFNRTMEFLRQHKMMRTQETDGKDLEKNEAELAEWWANPENRSEDIYNFLLQSLNDIGQTLIRLTNNPYAATLSNIEYAGVQGINKNETVFILVSNGNVYRNEWLDPDYIVQSAQMKRVFQSNIEKNPAIIGFWFEAVYMTMLELLYVEKGHSLSDCRNYQDRSFSEENLIRVIKQRIDAALASEDAESAVISVIKHYDYEYKQRYFPDGEKTRKKGTVNSYTTGALDPADKVRAILSFIVDQGHLLRSTKKTKDDGQDVLPETFYTQTLYSAISLAHNAQLVNSFIPNIGDENATVEKEFTALFELYDNEIPTKGNSWE